MVLNSAKSNDHHWAAILCGEWSQAICNMCQHRDDFHCLLVQANLVLSLQAEFEQGFQLGQKQGRPLLDYALDYERCLRYTHRLNY